MPLLAAMQTALRRLGLQRSAPQCPGCQSRQVQLREWLTTPAQWKCRGCKLVWWQDKTDDKPVAYACHPEDNTARVEDCRH